METPKLRLASILEEKREYSERVERSEYSRLSSVAHFLDDYR